MVQIFALGRVLEREYESVLRGIPVEYGSQAKMYTAVAESMGVPRERKRRADKNDGRAPDTTDALLGKTKQTGRPRGALNVDRNPMTTYQSYRASSEATSANRCWEAALLECLFALFSPLWLVGLQGFKTSLFGCVARHLQTRMTYELNGLRQIKSILTKGQTTIARALNEASPGSF